MERERRRRCVKVNIVCEAAREYRTVEKEVGEARLLRHLSPHSESLSADKSVCFKNGSWGDAWRYKCMLGLK